MSDLRVLFCASEAAPFAKTGGLADVLGALPSALQQLGCDVRVFMPLYRSARSRLDSLRPVAENLVIPVGVHDYHVHLWESSSPSGVPFYFLEKEEFFDRTSLYGTPERGDYEDNPERFITFCQSTFALCRELNWFPEIFHLHDWQAALIATYHSFMWRYDPRFVPAGTVFTIHNLGYQGLFPASCFSLTHLPSAAYSIQGLEYWGQCNFLKAGILHSDFVTAVSPTYSLEIQKPENGMGMDGILRDRRGSLAGILNGVDYSVWCPETDPAIPANYSAADLSGKFQCKEALLTDLGFSLDARDRPLLGMISRLATQKGFDLVLDIMEEVLSMPVSVVILGTGEREIEEKLRSMAERHPEQLRVLFEFDEQRSHCIEAGSDIFLMPSRYEPCGLNQMYSLRYGTVPVVHATGGLMDSITDVVQHPGEGTGVKFYAYDAGEFLAAVRSAVEIYHQRETWHELQVRAMGQDFSWTRSAREYLRIYEGIRDHKAMIRSTGLATSM